MVQEMSRIHPSAQMEMIGIVLLSCPSIGKRTIEHYSLARCRMTLESNKMSNLSKWGAKWISLCVFLQHSSTEKKKGGKCLCDESSYDDVQWDWFNVVSSSALM